MLTIFLIKNDIFFIYKKNKELTRVTRSKLVTQNFLDRVVHQTGFKIPDH
jgi:hypothetical protein